MGGGGGRTTMKAAEEEASSSTTEKSPPPKEAAAATAEETSEKSPNISNWSTRRNLTLILVCFIVIFLVYYIKNMGSEGNLNISEKKKKYTVMRTFSRELEDGRYIIGHNAYETDEGDNSMRFLYTEAEVLDFETGERTPFDCEGPLFD